MRRNQANAALALATIVLLAAAARLLLAIPAQHMREDEMLSFRYTEGSLVDVVRYQATQDNQAPLWYIVFRGWRTLAGDHEVTARVLSIGLTLLTTAILYRLACRWFGGAAGVYTTAAVLGSVYLVPYALEIRPYALALLVAAVSMWTFDRWLTRPTLRRAVIYGISAAGLLYTHYFLAFLLLVQAVYALIVGRPRSAIHRGGALAIMTAGVVFSVQVPVVISQLRVLRQLAEQAGQVYGVGIGTPHTSEPTTPETIARLIDTATNGAPWVFALIGVIGVWSALRPPTAPQRRWHYALAWAWALAVPAVMLIVNIAAAVYGQRYAVYAALGLALAVGGALALVRPRWLGMAGAAALLTVIIAGYPDRAPVRIPYRDIYTALSAVGGEVISVPPLAEVELAAFNADRYLTLPIVDQPSARDVWFVTGDWFGEAAQMTFGAIERERPLQNVLGQCDRAWCYLAQHLQAPPLAAPIIFRAGGGDQLAFYGIDLDAVAHTAIRTRLWWRVESAVAQDYTFALHVSAADGTLAAQADGALVHYGREMVPTTQLLPGQIYIDWRTVTPAAPLAAGTYALSVLVYQPWDGARLMTSDGADHLPVGTITLP